MYGRGRLQLFRVHAEYNRVDLGGGTREVGTDSIARGLLRIVGEYRMRSEADNIIGLYQRHGLAWAQDRGNRLVEAAWLDRFRALLPAPASILDLGCGFGEPIGRYFIEHGCQVTGIDSSPPLIELCQRSFPGHHWRIADMRALSLEQTFNGILAWDSFFHLCPEDQREMFPIFRKHAALRAALMFTSGPSHGIAMGSLRGESLYHASLDAVEYRALLDTSGFDVVDHVIEDPHCGGRTVWLAQLR
jgi:SAM-dependent methyltransferase